ncbi:MAG: glycoside hydrolase family 9 protein [Ginsengibacter sp.]
MKLIYLLLYLGLIGVGSSFSQGFTDLIKLNQIGFYMNGPKVAIVTGKNNDGVFYITTTNFRDTVYRGNLSAESTSKYSTTNCRIANFSTLQKPGSYTVVIPNLGHSYIFTIGQNVHEEVARAALKGYYYQRASMELEEKYAGKWHRSSGHPDNEVDIHPAAASSLRPSGTTISVPGGWYDAGDYNKYIVNSGISMGTLLAAYEDFESYSKSLRTNIPGSQGVPDLLKEILYNLRWMLAMQDPNDGGVYNKCTNASFDGMVMPGVTQSKRYVVPKGTAATLDFAAVTAQAARIFSKYNSELPGLADSCKHAAVSAWKWSEKNPNQVYDQAEMNKLYEPKITTGAYGDSHFDDEWFWASSELFVTTKDEKFLEVAEKKISELWIPSWNNVQMLGVYTLIRSERLRAIHTSLFIKKLRSELLHLADSLILGSSKSSFNTIIGQSTKDFIWGSNSVAANQSIVLINAYQISSKNKYLNYALSNLDYILGRNATGYCFLTGFGSKSTLHPHHRQSVSDGVFDPVPGLLAGGPNPGRQDGQHYEFTESETAYLDKSEAYASNEIAINWNAPLVYLAIAMERLQKKLTATN